MNLIRAELLKILKVPFIWILSGVYLIVFFLLFYQYTLNSKANIVEPLLQDPIHLSSFFLLIFSVFLHVIFSITLGSYISSREYADNTISMLIQSTGRYQCYIAKIIALFLIVAGRLLLSICSSFFLAFMAMTISLIFESASKSNIICILVFLAQNFMPYDISNYCCKLLGCVIVCDSFSNKKF